MYHRPLARSFEVLNKKPDLILAQVIYNLGRGKTSEIVKLTKILKNKVRKKFGINLDEEMKELRKLEKLSRLKFASIDKVIENNIPIEINRKGKKLKIVAVGKINKFKNLKRRNVIVGDPEDLVNISFEKEWKPYI